MTEQRNRLVQATNDGEIGLMQLQRQLAIFSSSTATRSLVSTTAVSYNLVIAVTDRSMPSYGPGTLQ